MNRVISEKIRFRNATLWSLTIRMAEMFLPYLMPSITKTPVILGTSTSAVPYGEIDLHRVWVRYIGEVTGGASPSPTVDVAVDL